MGKISSYPQDTSPTTDDYLISVDAGSVSNRRVLLSDLLTLFFNQQNIPSGSASPVTRHTETMFDFVASGMVWSGDSYGVNRNASMTAGVIYINGRRISISAVVARTFTASKDTYIDVLDNTDGTGTLVYTEVTNNAASPALAANSVRIGIIVTGATTIAAAGSVNQGQETKVLPIASGVPYMTTDSIGNLICPRDANRRILAYKELTTDFTTASTSSQQITPFSLPCIIPTNRKIKLTLYTGDLINNTANDYVNARIFDGSIADANTVAGVTHQAGTGADAISASLIKIITPSSTTKTYIAGLKAIVGGTALFSGAALGGTERGPANFTIELV